jgi:hypothetical protein
MQIEGYIFSGPHYHTKPFQKDFGCVYVLLNNLNQIVDVGQTSSVNSRIINHERKMCWLRHGCENTGLYVYISNDESFRLLLERLIRLKYNPLCGER